MEIPIYIDGAPAGSLTVEKRGAITWFRGDMEDPGRVVRLYLFGEREAYLGVPIPEEGRLRLLRRVTPSELRRFPRLPEYAAEEPLCREEAKAPEARKLHVLWHGGRPHFFRASG